MKQYTVSLDCYELPDDGALARQAVLDALASALHSIHVEMYGFADRELAQALLSAHTRGVKVLLILDHTEATTPVEVQLLHWLLASGFPADQVMITTSPNHAIMHRKDILIDAESDGFLLTGSTNWSLQAFMKQDNDLYVLHSPQMAADACAGFTQLWTWAAAHEAAYQLKAA